METIACLYLHTHTHTQYIDNDDLLKTYENRKIKDPFCLLRVLWCSDVMYICPTKTF